MAYINKIVVNGAEVNANQLEGILDKDGHSRFIEGDMDINPITGVTFKYKKWSLSGSHLMLVLSGIIASGTTIPNAEVIGAVGLPTWIMNKIFPVGEGNISNIISYNDFNLVGVSSYNRENEQFYIQKDSVEGKLFINKSGSLTTTEDLYFRLQFDLVIDNA